MLRTRFLSHALFVSAAGTIASAQNTRIIFTASLDCAADIWSDRIDALPGQRVYVQMRLSAANWGTQTALGLAGITLQPTLSGWRNGDTVLPFSDPHEPLPGPCFLGVVPPFGSNNPITTHVDPGGVLRFARPEATTPTTNLAWGVSIGQTPPVISGTIFREGTDVVVFRYGVVLSDPDDSPRDMIASVYLNTILQTRASWYRTPGGTGSLLTSVRVEDIVPATIRVIPAPGVVAACAIGSFMLTSRRRRS